MKVRVSDSRGLHAAVDVENLGQLVPISGLDVLLSTMHGERTILERCPVCQWSLVEAEETGLMGCGFCHSVFSELRTRLQNPNSTP